MKRSSSSGNRNPLFMQWLREWKEDAARKELRSQYTYAKALRSLEKYPLTIYSGKDCKLLEGFGDKLCQSIDTKLQKYMDELGSGQSVVEVINNHRDSLSASSGRKNSTGPAKKRIRRSNSAAVDSVGTSVNPHNVRNTENRRDYAPQKGTGAYALLITLLQNENENNGTTDLSKKELMRMAQPLADKSFIMVCSVNPFNPRIWRNTIKTFKTFSEFIDPGSRYTAWSSMGTLIKKQLVNKLSNPAKYSLTDSGRNLAILLKQGKSSESSNANGCADRDTSHKVPLVSHKSLPNMKIGNTQNESDCYRSSIVVSESEARIKDSAFNFSAASVIKSTVPSLSDEYSASNTASTSSFTEILSKRFMFSYVSDDNMEQIYKDKAAVTVDEEIGVGFLIKAKYEDLLTSGLRYKLDFTRLSADDCVHAYLHDSDAPETVPKPPILSKGAHNDGATSSFQHNTESVRNLSSTANNDTQLPKTNGYQKLKTVGEKKVVKTISSASTSSSLSEKPSSATSRFAFPPVNKTSQIQQKTLAFGSSSSSTVGETVEEIKPTNIDFTQPDFVLTPGSFDIVLCVDNHEVKAGKSVGQDMMIRELNKKSVMYDVRPLQVGDFLWVARSRTAQADGSAGINGRVELVLEHIIERKRMDDLASSIMDGRYKEQKHRLRNCGLKHPAYLVEQYGSIQNFTITEDSLNQAIINTRVVDEFFVKKTQDTKESAEYLAMMTNSLQKLYSRRTLLGFKRHFKWSECSRQQELCLMTFDAFNAASMKTRPLTVKETFAKNLLCISGITIEKASAIVKLYPSPSILLNAYKKSADEKSRYELLADLKFGSNKRCMLLRSRTAKVDDVAKYR